MKAEPGENLLRVAQHNDIPLEGFHFLITLNYRCLRVWFACECGLACATCHVILDKKHYDAIPEPTEEEEDCLDNASGITETY